MDRLGVGGAETWLMELLQFWHRRAGDSPRLDFLATSGCRGHFDDEARSLGARIHYLRFGRSDIASFAGGWRRILRDEGYAAIHDHQEFASGWHLLAGLGHLPPVRIAHVHNPMLGLKANYGVTPGRRLVAGLGWRLTDSLATHICGTSWRILAEHGYGRRSRSSPQVAVVHCGFDIDKFSVPRAADRASVLSEFAWPADAKVVLSVGRVDRALAFDDPQNHKNSWFALNVARLALERDPDVRYLVAGGGGAREEMEARIALWGLQDKLRFIGLRDDIPRLMRAADLLLFPSAGEGLGMAAVEAQATGLPVLASTAVPDEAIAVPELYHALALSEQPQVWADVLLTVIGKRRLPLEYCREKLSRSDFAIARSAAQLVEIYKASAR